ncbi:Aste57867_23481 [Aphanomyces stellatus]|uniref:Aste57867_23481 protein n=1 Tax=Aphanomyces stellatus TaxID=120398 RepID=A0A485LN69_9STRA|nr:hypothetical protein As57867_023410 [Aphanomyces stellatus]VFU00126.1 Aste57867_23481 [Aphanomyces stellatus]
MSTLTSTQMNVRRSSTRVHGPPGGASQLTFGPGGFGTSAPIPEEADPESRDAPPPTAASQYPRADFIPQKPILQQSMPINHHRTNQQQQHGNSPPFQQQMQAQTPYPQQSQYNQQRPPPTGYARPPATAYAPPPTGQAPMMSHRPSTTGSGWGNAVQPPLTSSKRDQNWEKKRRQWLARKNGGSSGGYSSSSFAPSTPSYDSGPPSPLAKLMHNMNMEPQQYSQQLGQYSAMPPRTSYNEPPPRTQQGYQQQQPPRTQQSSFQPNQQQFQQPPNNARQGNAYGPPPTGYQRQGSTPTTGGYQDHGAKPNNVFLNSGAAQFGAPPSYANSSRMPTAGSVPSTAASTRSTRQAPGGTSNWSPYG